MHLHHLSCNIGVDVSSISSFSSSSLAAILEGGWGVQVTARTKDGAWVHTHDASSYLNNRACSILTIEFSEATELDQLSTAPCHIGSPPPLGFSTQA
jgi:predicted amino acid racemase